MHRFAIFQCHHANDAVSELWDPAPVSNAAIQLRLLLEWLSQYALTPLPVDVGTLSQHDIFEIGRRLEHMRFQQGSALKQQRARGALLLDEV